MWKIEETREVTKPYNIEEKQNLSLNEYRDIAQQLRLLSSQDWAKLSITDHSITVNEKTMNFRDGHSWNFDYVKQNQPQEWNVISCQNIEYTHR